MEGILSGVHQRNRQISEYEFYHKAVSIRVEVTKLMASQSVVPKSYRFLLSVPTVETARSAVYNITRANAFYPNNSHNALERRKYLTLAIADCEQLLQDFQCLLDLGLSVNANRFQAIVEDIDAEVGLLKGARKNVKITGAQSVEDRIAAAREEIERLSAL